jgi:hypothetical protein
MRRMGMANPAASVKRRSFLVAILGALGLGGTRAAKAALAGPETLPGDPDRPFEPFLVYADKLFPWYVKPAPGTYYYRCEFEKGVDTTVPDVTFRHCLRALPSIGTYVRKELLHCYTGPANE